MKRAIGLLLLFIACIAGFLTVKGILPFVPVFNNSMEPALRYGSLLTIKPVNPEDIKIGDVIVFNVPLAMRKYYNYPAIVSRRVIEIKTVPSLSFRTKGDNASVDPFAIGPADVRGIAGAQIPYLAFPLLFFQSPPGLILVIFVLALLAVLLYFHEGTAMIFRRIFAPVMNKREPNVRVAVHNIEASKKRIDAIEGTQPQPAKAVKVKSKPPLAPFINRIKPNVQAIAQKIESSEKKGAATAQVPPRSEKTARETPKPLLAPVVNEEKPNIQAIASKIESPEKKIAVAAQVPPRSEKAVKETVETSFPSLNKPTPSKDDRKHEELPEEALSAEKTLFEALDRLNNMLKKTKNQV
jgi:signal peptidase